MAREKDKITRKAFDHLYTNSKALSWITGLNVVYAEAVTPRVRKTILERENDIVIRIRTKDGRQFMLHIEFQSSNDPDMVIRMAIYDYLVYEEHKLEVLSIVIYIGNVTMNMENKIQFFNNNYSCRMVDIKTLDPQLFMNEKDPRLVIFAVLAGPDESDREEIIKEIFIKLQQLIPDSETERMAIIAEMEFLAQARSKYIQQLIKKEVDKMPVTLDIRNSLFYKDVVLNTKLSDAERMIKLGMSLEIIRQCTELNMKALKALQRKLQVAG